MAFSRFHIEKALANTTERLQKLETELKGKKFDTQQISRHPSWRHLKAKARKYGARLQSIETLEKLRAEIASPKVRTKNEAPAEKKPKAEKSEAKAAKPKADRPAVAAKPKAAAPATAPAAE